MLALPRPPVTFRGAGMTDGVYLSSIWLEGPGLGVLLLPFRFDF